MNEFERRWKRTVAVARPHFESAPGAPPYGFATRVVGQRHKASTSVPSGADWQSFAWRVLGAMTLALLAIVMLGGIPREPFAPAIEASVTDIFWLL